MTDQEIIIASISGDEDAFAEIIRRYESKVAAIIIGMLGNCPEADDVGQETFIRFYKNMKNFRGESSVSTYLIKIAMNLALNELRRRKRNARVISLDDPEVTENIGDTQSKRDTDGHREIVQWAVDQLEPKFRSVVVLRMIDGYSTEETARLLELPVGTVLSRMSRAKRHLLKLLAPYKEQL